MGHLELSKGGVSEDFNFFSLCKKILVSEKEREALEEKLLY